MDKSKVKKIYEEHKSKMGPCDYVKGFFRYFYIMAFGTKNDKELLLKVQEILNCECKKQK
jgi:hypothetical protein